MDIFKVSTYDVPSDGMQRSVKEAAVEVAESLRKYSERRHVDGFSSGHLMFALIYRDGSIVAAYIDVLLVMHPGGSCCSLFDICSGRLQHMPMHAAAAAAAALEEESKCFGLGELKREAGSAAWPGIGARLRELEAIRHMLSDKPVSSTTIFPLYSSTRYFPFKWEGHFFHQQSGSCRTYKVPEEVHLSPVWTSDKTHAPASLSSFKTALQAFKTASRLWFGKAQGRPQQTQRIAEEAMSFARQGRNVLSCLNPVFHYDPSSGAVTVYSVQTNSDGCSEETQNACCYESSLFAMSLRCGGCVCFLHQPVSHRGLLTATTKKGEASKFSSWTKCSADRSRSACGVVPKRELQFELQGLLKRTSQVRLTEELVKGDCRGVGDWLEPLFLCLSFRLAAILESELSKHIWEQDVKGSSSSKAGAGVPLIPLNNTVQKSTERRPSSENLSEEHSVRSGCVPSQGLHLEVCRTLRQLNDVYLRLESGKLSDCFCESESSVRRGEESHSKKCSSPGGVELPSHFPSASSLFKKPLELRRTLPEEGSARQPPRASAKNGCTLCNSYEVDLSLPLLIFKLFIDNNANTASALSSASCGLLQRPFHADLGTAPFDATGSANDLINVRRSCISNAACAADSAAVRDGTISSWQNRRHSGMFIFPEVHCLFVPLLGAAFFTECFESSLILETVSTFEALSSENESVDIASAPHQNRSFEEAFSNAANKGGFLLASEGSECIQTLRWLFDLRVSAWRSVVTGGDIYREDSEEVAALRPVCWTELDLRGLPVRWRSLSLLRRDGRRKHLWSLFASSELILAWIERRSVAAVLEGVFLLEAVVSVPLEPHGSSFFLEAVLSECTSVLEEVQPAVATELALFLDQDFSPDCGLKTDFSPLGHPLLSGVARAAVQARLMAASTLRRILLQTFFDTPAYEAGQPLPFTRGASQAPQERKCKYHASVVQQSAGENIGTRTHDASTQQGVKWEWRVIRIHFPVFEKSLSAVLNTLAKSAGALATACFRPKHQCREKGADSNECESFNSGSSVSALHIRNRSVTSCEELKLRSLCRYCPTPFALFSPPMFFVTYWKDERVLVSIRFAAIRNILRSSIELEENATTWMGRQRRFWFCAAAQRHAKLLEVCVPDALYLDKAEATFPRKRSTAKGGSSHWQKKFAFVLQAISVRCTHSEKWILRIRGSAKVEAALLHIASVSAVSRVLQSTGQNCSHAELYMKNVDLFTAVDAVEAQHIAEPVLSCLSKLKSWMGTFEERWVETSEHEGGNFVHVETGQTLSGSRERLV